MPNTLAADLNETIRRANPYVYQMLSELGRELYFPKGILTQTAEAKQKATRYNVTIGIARENGQAMHLLAVMKHFAGLSPDEVLPYAPSPGRQELRAKWKELLYQKNPLLRSRQVSLPVVTSGITHGLSIIADMLVDRENVLLLPDKLWGNYNMIFGVRRGANIVKYPFFGEKTGLDVAGFRQVALDRVGGRKIIVLLNFPNNPTGYSPTEAEATAICDTLQIVADRGCNVVAVCDDAYFGLFYEANVLKESLFAQLADLHERILAVKLDGATKEDYVWGLRLGFITLATKTSTPALYEALEKKIGGCIRGTISNCSHAAQSILLKAMSDVTYGPQHLENFEVLRRRAAKVKEVLSQERFSAAWTPYPFNSGYFMCLKLTGLNAELFRLRLLEKYGVGVIATAETDIRVAFSCVEEQDIPDLFDQMFKCAQEMASDGASLAQAAPQGAFEE
ncbi:MAG: aminotransferase class I/II-fold pyridoxal phosphate-dependent enzyme [Verrucomicrobia bacterium]|nr:aminotransferase class I/II-fold pyridoxal phosphate-dependent enzyme [Verrucomicrobiota bacterium]MBU4292211.1 aminotransferase class I/II-fold pyridoxal phosphate-dependent enzyme [Verrucomicrobiota bacterium]MBU4496402.1 aminotransferase class I/II-fold pyridoxal phosphate-dependent enzyme [Verrucomicrobiota bacterium]MCG2680431.1 aminotransferase class I/II-fold pyridoxal phosphate-dependent enzyme [Kiritimatiellia bacterium]